MVLTAVCVIKTNNTDHNYLLQQFRDIPGCNRPAGLLWLVGPLSKELWLVHRSPIHPSNRSIRKYRRFNLNWRFVQSVRRIGISQGMLVNKLSTNTSLLQLFRLESLHNPPCFDQLLIPYRQKNTSLVVPFKRFLQMRSFVVIAQKYYTLGQRQEKICPKYSISITFTCVLNVVTTSAYILFKSEEIFNFCFHTVI